MSNTQLDEIRSMQTFLGIQERPITIFRRSGCQRDADYEMWLPGYIKELREQCKRKLVSDFNNNLGERLFKEKFSTFQEFAR